jgi:type IV pilus assembly protein PilB
MPVRLGELLLKENMVSPQQLQDALNHAKQVGGKIGKAFVSLGFVKDEEITSLLSRQYGVPSINLDHFEVDPAIIKIIPAETARKYQVLPLSRSGATLTIAMADPTNVFAMDDIKFMTGYNVEPVVASESALEDAIDRYYGSTRSLELRREGGGGASGGGGYGIPGGAAGGSIKEMLDGPTLSVDDMAAIGGLSEIDLDAMSDADADVETVKTDDDEIDLGNLAKSADAAPVIKLTNVLLVDSLKRGASDIHIEPYEKEFRVRFRIDGILYNVMALPMKLKDPLISRVKIMAKLDIAEKRLPQDGRIKIKMKVEDRSRDLDFRVSVLPTLWGEKIVMRLLDKSKLMLDMTKLGFEQHSLDRFKTAISKPYGIVLVTGPTGSGKTNTLYSAIAALNKSDTNIMTAEDPVEFNLPGINQVQIRENIGLNFAAVLRSFLRQDPNIILVGEIRDYETAEIAVKAALTGHLVLSTLHTNDAPSTVSRMVNMGIEPFLVGTAVNLIQAQRLVRRVCAKCKVDVTAEVPSKTLIDIGFTPEQIGSFQVMKGKGCQTCNGTGYKGRVGLYEVMEITEGIRDLIMVGATAVEIKRKALEEGMLTLRMSGLEKIKNGVTTVEEVLRETVL